MKKILIAKGKSPELIIPLMIALFYQVAAYCQSRPDAWAAFLAASAVGVYGKVFHKHSWTQVSAKCFIAFIMGTMFGRPLHDAFGWMTLEGWSSLATMLGFGIFDAIQNIDMRAYLKAALDVLIDWGKEIFAKAPKKEG